MILTACPPTSTSSSQQRSASPACMCISAASCSTLSLPAAPTQTLATPLPRTLSSSRFAVDTSTDRTLLRWHKQPGSVQQPLPPMLQARLWMLRLPVLPWSSLSDAALFSCAAGMPHAGRAGSRSFPDDAAAAPILGSAPRCSDTAAASCHRFCVEAWCMNAADIRAKSSKQAAGPSWLGIQPVTPEGPPDAVVGQCADTHSASWWDAGPHSSGAAWSLHGAACMVQLNKGGVMLAAWGLDTRKKCSHGTAQHGQHTTLPAHAAPRPLGSTWSGGLKQNSTPAQHKGRVCCTGIALAAGTPTHIHTALFCVEQDNRARSVLHISMGGLAAHLLPTPSSPRSAAWSPCWPTPAATGSCC